MFIMLGDEQKVPEGYRKLTDEEIVKDYLIMDINENYCVSKNEWMLHYIKLLGKDINALEKEGPDSIMKKIQELSDEFDVYDLDGSKYLDYEEYKNIITNNIYISD